MQGPAAGLAFCLALALSGTLHRLQAQTPNPSATNMVILAGMEGKVEVALAATDNWVPGKPNQVLHPGDRVRTDQNGRALLRSSRLGELRVRQASVLTITAPARTGGRPVFELLKGFFYFFNQSQF